MDSRFSSMLDELTDYLPARDRDLFVESRGQQVIASAMNLIRLLRETYDAEIAEDLSKRLVRSIASGDEEKFRRRVRSIREARQKRVVAK